MNKATVAKKFQQQVLSFLDELIVQFPNEPDFVLSRLMCANAIGADQLIRGFIQEALPFRDHIQNKDETFFLNADISIFKKQSAKTNHMKLLWKSSALTDEDKEIIWTWMTTFLFLADKYSEI